jgi:hypothetical protein
MKPGRWRLQAGRIAAALHAARPPAPANTVKAGALVMEIACRKKTLPNATGGYSGNAPDLGALELGQPLPHYGPRS